MGIKYYPQVFKRDLPHLDSLTKERVQHAILHKLQTEPSVFGEPLHGILKPHWKLRVGDYRVIYKIIKSEVQIIAIGHRKEIYKLLENRI